MYHQPRSTAVSYGQQSFENARGSPASVLRTSVRNLEVKPLGGNHLGKYIIPGRNNLTIPLRRFFFPPTVLLKYFFLPHEGRGQKWLDVSTWSRGGDKAGTATRHCLPLVGTRPSYPGRSHRTRMSQRVRK